MAGPLLKTSDEIRRGFLDFFRQHDHTLVPSAPLIPPGDPTLLFTNSGMVQFKGAFIGEERRSYSRAASCQKCMRAGGKHNDLEKVGLTGRHHTFFEMLGNFSFGDYFKEQAIELAWEFLTSRLALPADRLWVTIYEEDGEAERLWREKIGVPADRIVRMGADSNFWQMGEIGPCGPCSEVYIDQGPDWSCGRPTCRVGCDCDRYLELWNLVFMQSYRTEDGQFRPLPMRNIDTGMGLERVAAICQGGHTTYDGDGLRPLIRAVEEAAGMAYGETAKTDCSLRVIADHLRAITFLIADGILPSNEGRGYVLRRIIRRAARHRQLLGLEAPGIARLTGTVVEGMAGAYPELRAARQTVASVVQGEEERFAKTLEYGTGLLTEAIQRTKAEGLREIPGAALFKLYDTYGFPLDLIAEMTQEEGLILDRDGFEREMAGQRARATKPSAQVSTRYLDLSRAVGVTRFLGYDQEVAEARVLAILTGDPPAMTKTARAGEAVEIVLDATPFYGEGGGQIGDRGVLIGPTTRVEIEQTLRPLQDLICHRGAVVQGELHEGDILRAHVDHTLRQGAARHHTATHVLHAVLRELFGEHLKQAGSLVASDRLRFDFIHYSALTQRDIDRVEEVVNERLREDHPVTSAWMSMPEALGQGALAIFEEKYGERVRLVRIAEFSKELCGGTHSRATGEVGLFKILHESSVAAGVRRIEAVTGEAAFRFVRHRDEEFRELRTMLRAGPDELLTKTQRLVGQLKEAEQQVAKLRLETAQADPAAATTRVADCPVVCQRLDGLGMDELRVVGDRVRVRMPSGVIVLGSAQADKAVLIAMVSPDLAGRFPAVELIRGLAPLIGGSGGGRPEMAQAGGKDVASLDRALAEAPRLIERMAGTR